MIYRIMLDGTFRTLHAFNSALDGNSPTGSLVQGRDGLLYGTTRYGGVGAFGNGTIFRSTLEGNVTVLHAFAGGSDGAYPGPLVQAADGNYYGKTSEYGRVGTFFRMMPAGVVTIVHRFTDYTNGNPSDVVVQGADGNIYGNFGCNGGIFRFGPSGFSVLTLLGRA